MKQVIQKGYYLLGCGYTNQPRQLASKFVRDRGAKTRHSKGDLFCLDDRMLSTWDSGFVCVCVCCYDVEVCLDGSLERLCQTVSP